MAAAVAPLSQPLPIAELSSAEARKRRREILSSQRVVAPDIALSVPASSLREFTVCPNAVSDEDSSSEEMPSKRQRITESSTTKKGKPAKKPQMKYDPEEPMTKEEAAVWRREQRRKRNRESAAASRQRQRDRITELEAEVEDWKTKYDTIMAKIAHLESVVTGKRQVHAPIQSRPLTIETPAKFVSPHASPSSSPLSSPMASPIASSPIVDAVKVTPGQENTKPTMKVEVFPEQHSNKMMSRLAVS